MASIPQSSSTDTSQRAADCTPQRGLRLRLVKAFRWVVTTSWLLMTLAVLLVGNSLIASILTGEWHWFQRSGALMVATGALLSTQRALTFLLDNLIDERECRRPSHSELPARMEPPEIRACLCGFTLVAAGTLVWAYGDLIGYLAV